MSAGSPTIVHVTPYLAPAWAHGRVPEAVWALATSQAADGWTVSVLTTDAMAPHERQERGEFHIDGVRVVRVRNASGLIGSWLQLSTPVGFRRHARALFSMDAPLLVHLHELRTVENWLVSGLIPGEARLIVSTHGTEANTTRGRRTLLPATCLTPLLRRIDHIVVTSGDEADGVRALWERQNIGWPPRGLSIVSPNATLRELVSAGVYSRVTRAAGCPVDTREG